MLGGSAISFRPNSHMLSCRHHRIVETHAGSELSPLSAAVESNRRKVKPRRILACFRFAANQIVVIFVATIAVVRPNVPGQPGESRGTGDPRYLIPGPTQGVQVASSYRSIDVWEDPSLGI